MTDETMKKLDMSLDDINQERRTTQDNGAGGKSKNTKRADRIAKSDPYPRHTRKDDSDEDMLESPRVGKRVYVGNLSWGIKWQDLKDHMRAAGDVEHADILETGGRSKGCGIVTYASEDYAKQAIETLNDTELDGRKIFVREDREEGSSSGGGRPHKGCRVYVGNLSWTVKWQELKDHMKQAGNVVHADVMEEVTGRSKGCGLVEYATPEEAQRAIDTLNDTELEGRMVFVREDREPDGGSISRIARPAGGRGGRRPAPSHSGHSDGRQLYVGNLPWDMSWQNLKDLCRTVGDVERAEVVEYPDGRSRGFGIVRFHSSDDADEAIARLNGSEVGGRRIEVRVDKRG